MDKGTQLLTGLIGLFIVLDLVIYAFVEISILKFIKNKLKRKQSEETY